MIRFRDFECMGCGKVITDCMSEECPCPQCLTCMRVLKSAPALAFKGKGWTPRHYGGKS